MSKIMSTRGSWHEEENGEVIGPVQVDQGRSVYHMCLCKAMGTPCATNICPFVESFILSGY